MAAKTYLKDFHDNYEHPQVDGLIVGFSGIDPQRKSAASGCQCDNSTLSDEQKAIVSKLIHDALSVIDFSSCECNPTQLTDEQKSIISKLIEDKINELDTCDCDNSSLSDEQKDLIKNIIDKRLEELDFIFDGGEIDDDNPTPAPAPDNIFDESNINHEKISGLLGGDDNGHFHLTNEQLKKLLVMIETFFPDGSEVVIIKPVSPVTPDEPPDEFDPYGGLPSGTPPAWEIRTLPNGYSGSGVNKMYYGTVPNTNSVLLAVILLKDNTSTNYSYGTNNLSAWNINAFSVPAAVNTITDFYYDKNHKFLFYTYWNHDGNAMLQYLKKGSGSGSSKVSGANSICFSELLNFILLAGNSGETSKITFNSSGNPVFSNVSSAALTVNPGCAAWHPTTAVFCLTGLEGTSTSFDGETWTLNTDTPHNLLELSYREDLDSFVARSGEDKTFYASPDGINWKQLSDTPVPLDNISTVHYNPDNNWYCAVGIGDGNAYFSKDLKHWIPTKLRNNSPVDVGDVIFMPSTGLYVAMPTSGNYFYTFNPSDWTD